MADAKRTEWGNMLWWSNMNITFNSMSLDASTDKIAQLIIPIADITVTDVGFRYGSRTGTPPTYKTGLQGVNTSGNPDGTYLGGGSPASKTFTPPADTTWNSTWQWVTLDNTIALTAGTPYFRVIEYSSGTINASNFSSFGQTVSGSFFDRYGIPFSAQDTGAGYTKTNCGLVGVKTSGSVYGLPIQNFITTASTLATNGHRATSKLTIPTNYCSTYKVRGIRLIGASEAAAGSNKFGIWNGAGTAIHTVTLDSDLHGNPGSGSNTLEVMFTGALTALDSGTAYYFGMERVGGSCAVNYFSFASSGDIVAMPFQGDSLLATWNGSAWAETNTGVPPIALILEDVTAPSGGSGMITHPGMVGGIRG